MLSGFELYPRWVPLNYSKHEIANGFPSIQCTVKTNSSTLAKAFLSYARQPEVRPSWLKGLWRYQICTSKCLYNYIKTIARISRQNNYSKVQKSPLPVDVRRWKKSLLKLTNQELKQQRRRRLRKRHLQSEVALIPSRSIRQMLAIFLELNSTRV